MGDRLPWPEWEVLLDPRFERRGAYLIPEGEFDWESSAGRTYVPATSSPTGSWRAGDALFAPLKHSRGHMLGIISVDEPLSGHRPDDAELQVLVAVAEHAAMALEASNEHAASERQQAALGRLLQVSSQMTETLAADAVLNSICEGISEALGFAKVALDIPDPETGVMQMHAGVGWGARGACRPDPAVAARAGAAAGSSIRDRGLLCDDPRRGAGPAARGAQRVPVGAKRRRPVGMGLPLADGAAVRPKRQCHRPDLGRRAARSADARATDAPADAAGVRKPGHGGARLGRPVRGDAISGRARPAHPTAQPARVHQPPPGCHRAVAALWEQFALLLCDLDGFKQHQRPARPHGRRRCVARVADPALPARCAVPTPSFASAATSSH